MWMVCVHVCVEGRGMCVCVCVCVCGCVCVWVGGGGCMFVCGCGCMFVCECVCMCVRNNARGGYHDQVCLCMTVWSFVYNYLDIFVLFCLF
jgi:hypothetical protein